MSASTPRATLVIDRERCEGHCQCVLVAPDLLDLDDTGAVVITVPDVTDRIDLARKAVQACPAIALSIAPGDTWG